MRLGFCCASAAAATSAPLIITTSSRSQNRRANMCMSHPPVASVCTALWLREERRKLVADADPEHVLLGRRRRPRWIPCRLQTHIPSAREELAHDKVDGDAARVLDKVQGDDRLRLHIPRVRQELRHEGLQGELIDAGALGVSGKREVLLEEKRELPARHRPVDIAERRPDLVLAVAHLRVRRGRKDQDRAHAERSHTFELPRTIKVSQVRSPIPALVGPFSLSTSGTGHSMRVRSGSPDSTTITGLSRM